MTNADPNAQLQRALALHQSGRLDAAIGLYRQLQKRFPASPQLLFLLGSAEGESGRSAEAVRWLEQCLVADPANANAWNNIGLAHEGLKRYDEALAAYERAIALQPAQVPPFINKGLILRRLGRYDEALASFDRALALDPASAEQHNNRANVLLDLGRLEDALQAFDRALALAPEYAEAHANRALALQALGRVAEGLASVDRAIALRPTLAEAHNFRGDLLIGIRREVEARESFQRAYSLDPGLELVFPRLLYARLRTCDWTGIDAQLAKLRKGIARGEQRCAPFDALGLIDSAELQLKVARRYAETKFPAVSSLGPIPVRTRGRRLRIGYFSADFRDHATTRLMAEFFELHDRDRFELIGFDFGPLAEDAMRRRVVASFDRFIDVRRMSDRDVARLAREIPIDVAIDLKGYTEDARPGIFAERAAPLQVNYLGFPGTMGAPFIDYIVADPVLIPPGHEAYYSEKIVRLPGSYQVNDRSRAIAGRRFSREELGLPADGFVFCCFNNNYKITPPIFDAWMRILKRVEGAVLWLIQDSPAAADNLRREAEKRGVAAHRLVFASRMPLADHLARHRNADLFLDTLPYNAHTTASDALWAGLPVLTLAGEAFASRVAASLLTAVGLPELITASAAEFESVAVTLAGDPPRLAALRDRLAHDRLASTPLFDTPRFARQFESALEQIHARWEAGRPADHLNVDPSNVDSSSTV